MKRLFHNHPIWTFAALFLVTIGAVSLFADQVAGTLLIPPPYFLVLGTGNSSTDIQLKNTSGGLTVSNSGNLTTFPTAVGSLVAGYTCGTVAANGACANTGLGTSAHVVSGIATLASNTSTITGLSPAFTSSTSYFCVANDITTRANPVQAIPASGSSVTFTDTTGATDNIQFICFGN